MWWKCVKIAFLAFFHIHPISQKQGNTTSFISFTAVGTKYINRSMEHFAILGGSLRWSLNTLPGSFLQKTSLETLEE